MKKLASWFENVLNKIKIKQSLTYLFIFVFFIPFILISFFYILILYNSLRHFELSRAQQNLQSIETEFTEVLSNISNLSDRLYVNKRLHKTLLDEYEDVIHIYEAYSDINYIEDYLHTYKEIASIRIYTQNENLLENYIIQIANQRVQNYSWYIKAIEMKGRAFWTIKEDSISREKYLCNIRSVWSGNDLVGVLVINVNPFYIQQSIENPNIRTFIVFDYNVVFSSSDLAFAQYEQQLIKYLYNNDYSISKMTNMIIAGERVGVVAVDLYPVNSVSLKFEVINVIPINQLISTTRKLVFHTIIIFVFILLLLIGVIIAYSTYIDIRVNKLNLQIESIVDNNFEIAKTIGGNDEFEQIYRTIKNMSANITDLIYKLTTETEKNNRLALSQSEISFKMLSNQINPHFLFNTLETIRMKALASSDKEVGTMLKLLASLLRYNLSVKGQPVPLIKELEAVQNYLTIQHMRFGERVSYDIVTLCDIQDVNVLPLLIQPLVENSFCHGLEDKVSGGFIYIMINMEKRNDRDVLVITVKDNGCGIEEEKLEEIRFKLQNYLKEDSSTSIGMLNVQSRIKMYYGEDFGITIDSEIGEGTVVTITI